MIIYEDNYITLEQLEEGYRITYNGDTETCADAMECLILLVKTLSKISKEYDEIEEELKLAKAEIEEKEDEIDRLSEAVEILQADIRDLEE